jgi:iron complex transport system substrate-binding protein
MPASALLLVASAGIQAASLKLCSDELLLALAEPRQLVSGTHLGRNPAETPLWRQGRRYRSNDGSLLSVVGFRPNVVVTMGEGARDQLRIASRLGIKTVSLPHPQSLADVESNIRRVAAALGRREAGAALLRRIAELRSTAPRKRIDAIWLGGGGRTVSPTGLEAQWMALAGLRQRPMQGDRVSLETLVAAPPTVLLRSDYRTGQYSAAQRWLTHPAARHARGSRTIATDGRPWTCMGPLMIDEILRLRRAVAQ